MPGRARRPRCVHCSHDSSGPWNKVINADRFDVPGHSRNGARLQRTSTLIAGFLMLTRLRSANLVLHAILFP